MKNNNVIRLDHDNIFTDKLIRAKDMQKIFLGIAQATFDGWVNNGYINRYKIGGSVFYKLSEVQKMIENARVS